MDEIFIDKSEIFLNILKINPISQYFFTILFSMLNMDFTGLIYLGACIVSIIVNTGLKEVIPKSYSWSRRPAKMPTTGCGYFPDPNFKIDVNNLPSGMPSGHAQSGFMFAIFWSLYLFQKYSTTKSDTQFYLMWFSIFLLFLMAVLVCFQRVYTKCHTPLQIYVGSIIGSILGYIFYRITYTFLQKEWPKTYRSEVVDIHTASIWFGVILLIMLGITFLLDYFIPQ